MNLGVMPPLRHFVTPLLNGEAKNGSPSDGELANVVDLRVAFYYLPFAGRRGGCPIRSKVFTY